MECHPFVLQAVEQPLAPVEVCMKECSGLQVLELGVQRTCKLAVAQLEVVCTTECSGLEVVCTKELLMSDMTFGSVAEHRFVAERT